jgi:hypothetical protein
MKRRCISSGCFDVKLSIAADLRARCSGERVFILITLTPFSVFLVAANAAPGR